MDVMVELRGVTKRFGDFSAVGGVDLEIQAGEFITLLGPSGCGKTTLLRMISGFETPTEGQVLLAGRDVTHEPPYRRDVNQVFQSYALFPHMTVKENIAFGLQMKKVPKGEMDGRIRKVIAMVSLEGMEARKPSQLSGGQRQRVALARALAPQPGLLLLDEPFGALDAKVRLELREWIRKLHKARGTTSVFVTHDQEEAMDLADRVIVLHRGKVEQIGTPEEIYDRPATEFVASFVGSMNVLNGQVHEGRAGFGTLGVHAPPGTDGANVRAFVRPHDVELRSRLDDGADPPAPADPAHAPGEEGPSVARIERLSRVGWMVKIELQLSDGQPLSVELTKDRVAELGLAEGDRVLVNLRDAKLFVQDYSI